MDAVSSFIIFISVIRMWPLLLVEAKVYMVLMEGDPFISHKSKQYNSGGDAEAMVYKEKIRSEHDVFLETVLERSSYAKLYSYTHLLNGFAINVESEKVLGTLQNATGVRAIYEDVKMQKLTTHTPDFLGISSRVWPKLGGANSSGQGVVIGLIDTGINPSHPSFRSNSLSRTARRGSKTSRTFKGKCITGKMFPLTACNGKIVGARFFARSAIAAKDFNASHDYASPFDADGHGSHTAAIAAGNHRIPVTINGFNYGYASGMAPGARIAVYKALYSFGGYMSDAVAAVDQAVEDGVDILSLSVGPSNVPSGPSTFLSILELELLFATKAGVLVVQAAGNEGPSPSSVLSFSPWITSVAASITDRKYKNTIILGNGQRFSGSGLAPPTAGKLYFPIAAAADVCHKNSSTVFRSVESCQDAGSFIASLVVGKLIICTYSFDFQYESATIAAVADTITKIGAAGFIITMDPDQGSEQIKGTAVTFRIPGIILNNIRVSSTLWDYYNSHTLRSRPGIFTATARILDGRRAVYTAQAPIVASYSSRGPDINNVLLQTADVLKPNLMAPGSSIWAAWSPTSQGDQSIKRHKFALLSGTSMATPHVAGIAALIKQKQPRWSPAAITSAMMTTADVIDHSGASILAQSRNQLVRATPFDFGAGSINPARATDPGLIFNAQFKSYVQFLCAVPGVDEKSVRRATGVACSLKQKAWCSDLNLPSVTVSNLVESRKVIRRVTSVSKAKEMYRVTVREPFGVNVAVFPRNFTIKGKASRNLTIVLKAREVSSGYTFGDIVMQGSKKHRVRIPIAVSVSTPLRS